MKYLNNRRGSSSILIVLTFTMLVIFSLLVMMSSYSDYKLAKKNADTTQEYYELLGKANEFRFKIESTVSKYSSKNTEEIIKELYNIDSNIFVDINGDQLIISRTFYNDKNKELLIELDYNHSDHSLNLLTIKEIPKKFEYEDVDFEDVEVHN